MIIKNSQINTASQSSYEKTTLKSTSIIFGNEQANPLLKNGGEAANAQNSQSAQTTQSGTIGGEMLLETGSEKFDSFTNTEELKSGRIKESMSMGEAAPKSPEELKNHLLLRMMEAFTGKSFKLQSLTPQLNTQYSNSPYRLNIQEMRLPPFSQRASSGGNQTLTITTEFAQSEKESVSYSAAGVVKTADGKTINIDLNMSMSRSTEIYIKNEMKFDLPEKRAVDPLIVNYAGTAASLTEQTYDFDLTADGETEKISFAGEGSGFLALDKNSDGKINDGSELFGPQSGNGFDELRKYDEDGNGWIDEADDVYSDLKVWVKDKDGNDKLYGLKELDVGAIYLNESQTDYGMYDSKGNMQGAMRSTSFFLKDSGGAGFISHFDLLV